VRRSLVLGVAGVMVWAAAGAVAGAEPRAMCLGEPVTIDMSLLPPGEPAVGTEDRDVILGTDQDDVIVGLAGDDIICGEDGDDDIRGGPGSDVIDAGSGSDTARGGPGDDELHGGAGSDPWINGGTGNDRVFGDAGNDMVIGGPGDDLIDGGAGDDGGLPGQDVVLLGQSGLDTIHGGPGDDLIRGGAGNDVINGDDGHDTVYGGDGSDVIGGDDGNDVIAGNNGRDTIYGGDGNDVIDGLNQSDRLYGGAGDDDIDGGTYADTIYGRTGNDDLAGGPGDDNIEGNEGNDNLDGGDGTDSLNGGLGTDVCTTGETLISCETTEQPEPWVRSFASDSGTVSSTDIAVDTAENSLLVGWFSGTVDFDPGPGTYELTEEATDNEFVVKLDAFGDLVWAFSFGGTTYYYPGPGVATDAAGNAHVFGKFEATVDFDPGPGTFPLTSSGGPDTYVVKLDASGSFLWAVQLDGQIAAEDLAVDGSGNLVITGRFRETADFDPGPGVFELTPAGGFGDDAFVLKLDSSGGFVWAHRFGSEPDDDLEAGNDSGTAVTLDESGNIYVTGWFTLEVDFDPGPGVSALHGGLYSDTFVVKLLPDGGFGWAAQFGDVHGWTEDAWYWDSEVLATSVTLDALGNIIITGTFGGPADFDPGASVLDLDSTGLDPFVVKLSPSGSLVWVDQFTGDGSDWGADVAVGESGELYVAGYFTDSTDFDPGPGVFQLSPPGQDPYGSDDAFLVRLDGASGGLDWARQLSSSWDARAAGVAVDGFGNVLFAGHFTGEVNFDFGSMSVQLTSSRRSGFIAKMTD
jgi:Ca2+-binding RTX toxin-like protein